MPNRSLARDSHTVFVNGVVNASQSQSRKSPGIIAVGKAGQNALLTKGPISGSFANSSYILWYPMDKAANNFERDPLEKRMRRRENFGRCWGRDLAGEDMQEGRLVFEFILCFGAFIRKNM